MTYSEWEDVKRRQDAHERERQVLFGNEGFAIGALQTVSAATSFGIISQLNSLRDAVGQLPVRMAFSGTVIALTLSVLSAFFRHEYKKWDVKARVADNEKGTRAWLSSCYLLAMRAFMWIATLLIVAALITLVVGMWTYSPQPPAPLLP
jgi:hypothetical protein